MKEELAASGKDVAFVVVNQSGKADNDDDRGKLAAVFELPIFQDADGAAWTAHAGAKDDLYVYGKDGKLVRFLPHAAGNTDLSTPEGLDVLRAAIAEANP